MQLVRVLRFNASKDSNQHKFNKSMNKTEKTSKTILSNTSTTSTVKATLGCMAASWTRKKWSK